jgi:hypothetical protein
MTTHRRTSGDGPPACDQRAGSDQVDPDALLTAQCPEQRSFFLILSGFERRRRKRATADMLGRQYARMADVQKRTSGDGPPACDQCAEAGAADPDALLTAQCPRMADVQKRTSGDGPPACDQRAEADQVDPDALLTAQCPEQRSSFLIFVWIREEKDDSNATADMMGR